MAKGQADQATPVAAAAANAARAGTAQAGASADQGAHKHSILGSAARDKIVLYVLYALCAGALIGEFVIHRHVGHPWEALPEFYPLYAFASIIVLIFAAKTLRKLVMRPEDYYDR